MLQSAADDTVASAAMSVASPVGTATGTRRPRRAWVAQALPQGESGAHAVPFNGTTSTGFAVDSLN
jgi:hypothetical protein